MKPKSKARREGSKRKSSVTQDPYTTVSSNYMIMPKVQPSIALSTGQLAYLKEQVKLQRKAPAVAFSFFLLFLGLAIPEVIRYLDSGEHRPWGWSFLSAAIASLILYWPLRSDRETSAENIIRYLQSIEDGYATDDRPQ